MRLEWRELQRESKSQVRLGGFTRDDLQQSTVFNRFSKSAVSVLQQGECPAFSVMLLFNASREAVNLNRA